MVDVAMHSKSKSYHGKNTKHLCTLIIISCAIHFVLSSDIPGHLQPIGKQRLPDKTIVDRLQFSPGGKDFYRKYLLPWKHVLIKNVAKNWPLVKKWKDLPDVDKHVSQHLVPVKREDFVSNETIQDVIEKKLEVNTILPKHSKLLEEIRLPLILQCQEFVDKLHSVGLRINNRVIHNIQLSSRDEAIVAFNKPLFVFIFGVNKTLSGDNIESANMSQIDLDKFPDITHIPYQFIEIDTGDLLYIPKYSWYYVGSSFEVSYTKIEFDYFGFNFNKNIPYVKALQDYKQYLLSHSSRLECNNTKSTVSHALNIAIDFKDELQISHLRIPKKNKKPDDVILASGYKMPVLGFGTALLNEKTYDSVKYALEIGYRLFDMAYGYPGAESGFSEALVDSGISREDVFVATKLHPRFLGYNETLYAIDESLNRLKVSYIDLYLIHSKECDDFLLKCEEGEPHGTWQESWRAMEHAMRRGKIRSLGVSNFYKTDILELLSWSEEPVSVVQNWFDPFNTDKTTRTICAEYNIRYMGYSTLGNYWKFLGLDINPVFESSTITGIAANYDYVISTVVLRWAIHENVTVIPRSSNRYHIAQNIRALDISLLQEEIDLINGFEEWMSNVNEEDLSKPNDDTANDDSNKSNDDLNKPNDDVKPNKDANKPKNEVEKTSGDVKRPDDDANKPNDVANKPPDDVNKPNNDANKPNDDMNKPSKELNMPQEEVKHSNGERDMSEL